MPKDDIVIRLKCCGPVDDATREDAVNEISRLRNELADKPWDRIIEANDKLLDLCESIIDTTEQIQAEAERSKADVEAKLEAKE